ncbi:MAG: hypothetical protein ACYDGN_17620 [Acidimicrobiales bacterium]
MVEKDPNEVRAADVFEFRVHQRSALRGAEVTPRVVDRSLAVEVLVIRPGARGGRHR